MQNGLNRKVALLTGYDPQFDRDAVGQYCQQLHHSIEQMLGTGNDAKELTVDLVRFRPQTSSEWLLQLPSVFAQYDLIHLQYPAEAWGASIMPGMYPGLLRRLAYGRIKLVTTFHEWRSMHPLRKGSIASLAIGSDGMVFVSNREQRSYFDSLYYRARPSKPVTRVIPIGVNLAIPTLDHQEIASARSRLLHWGGVPADLLVGYFGFVYAWKQPEMMLSTIRRLLDRGIKARLVMAGDFPADHTKQRAAFLQRIESMGLRDHVVFLGFVADEKDLAQTLSACDVVLQLFADGVSARRSSFWYALELGVPMVTTWPAFSQEFDELLDVPELEAKGDLCFVAADATADAVAGVVLRQRAFIYPTVRRGISPDWPSIAHQHVRLYEKLLGG